MMRTARLASRLLVGAFFSISAAATPPVHIIKTDLQALIRGAIGAPVQFAVHVPHSASLTDAGTWSDLNGQSTWRYTVRVPSAISMSFHATAISLPAGASLTVQSAKTKATYTAREIHGATLWSRIQPGDTLAFTLTLPTAARRAAVLQIESVQAGYRSLGAGTTDHPYYRRLIAKQSGTGNASCVQNYECSVASANAPAAAATVGVVVGNLYQCTGTLINDVPGDNTPYVLTARHCETGKLGGGNPGAASNITIYWDATSACGSALGSLYDPGIPVQSGATTVVEQQDAWLVRLDFSPIVGDAQFAGFDAGGGAVQGGYTVHHALGYDKQYTTWFGQAAAVQMTDVLTSSYVSNFWETVNATGNSGPGASGSALVDQNNHVVGSMTLGRQDDDASGYESCPASNPPVPNGTNGSNDFTALASVWNSTADSTSTTGQATLESVLDPANSGTLVVASMPAASISFTSSTYGTTVGSTAELSWNAPSATACSASGGTGSDGWTGALSASGSQQVSESAPSIVTYLLTCALGSGKTINSELTINWGSASPRVNFEVTGIAWATTPATLSWASNVAPCSITGGALSLSGLASSGSTTTTQPTTGSVTYQLQCGSPTNYVTTRQTVQYVTPSMIFTANGTDRQLGQPLVLSWLSYAQVCIPSGGAPNDGWTTTAFGVPGSYPQFSPNLTTVGTYTYTLTCRSANLSVQQSITVAVENNPGYVTASVNTMSTTYSHSPADYITLSWQSNLTTCSPAANGSPQFINGTHDLPTDTGMFAPPSSGSYVLTVTCNPYDTIVGQVASTPITVTVNPAPPPTATISVVPSTVSSGQSFTVAWSTTDTTNCIGNGTIPPDVTWDALGGNTSGSFTTSTSDSGQYSFGLSCPSIDSTQGPATAQASLTVTAVPPTASLSTDKSAYTNGQNITLTWSSTNAAGCTAGGGGANGSSWAGALAASGTATQTATTNGTFTYTVTCASATQSAQAQATVTVSAPAAAGKAGGGGGGAIGILEIGALAIVWRMRRSERPSARLGTPSGSKLHERAPTADRGVIEA